MIDDSEFNECRNCHCAAARREAQRLTRLYDEPMRSHGLTISQFTMLVTLIFGGPATINVLAERLGIDRTTLSRNVALSEERGLVATGQGRDDARERIISLTAKGRQKAEEALPTWRAAQAARA